MTLTLTLTLLIVAVIAVIAATVWLICWLNGSGREPRQPGRHAAPRDNRTRP